MWHDTLSSQRWRQDRLHASWQGDLFLLTPICPVWSRLVLNHCKGSRRSTGGWVAVKNNLNFIHHFCVCVHVRVLNTRACVWVCVHFYHHVWAVLLCQLMRTPLTHGSQAAWARRQQQHHPITALLSPGPVKRKCDIMKAQRPWTLALLGLAWGNSVFKSQILDLSSQKIWASSFAQVFTFSSAKANQSAQLATVLRDWFINQLCN